MQNSRLTKDREKMKIKRPRDLKIEGFDVAQVTHDRKGVPSIRLSVYHPKSFQTHVLMGTPSSKRIAKWLETASEWVTQEIKNDKLQAD